MKAELTVNISKFLFLQQFTLLTRFKFKPGKQIHYPEMLL
jgi:hypothetical protein